MTASPFDHPLLGGLLGDPELQALLSAAAEIAGIVRFEAALARAEAAERVIPAAAGKAIAAALTGFRANPRAIARAVARDGVITVELVRQMRRHVGAPHAGHLHFGATSQDAIDTSLILRLAGVIELLDQRLATLVTALEQLAAEHGARKLIGRTRMQDALPIPVGARIEAWSAPLARHRERLSELRPRLLLLQFGGAVGTLDQLGNKGRAVGERMARELGLGLPPRSWHTQRDSIAEFGSWLALCAGALGKLGADVTLMAQNAIGEVVLGETGGSSAMPHKHNPVRAEILVALARYGAALNGGLQQALVHEQERSGAAWTLEWLVLPQLLMTTGAALRTADALVGSIEDMGVAHG